MAIPNTVQVGGIIAPGAVVDTYPVTDPRYGLGGLRTVDSYSDLSSIPNQRIQEGMVVYVSGGPTPAYYSYVNSNWVLFSNDTTVLTNSANWQSVYTSVNTTSGSWDNAYNTGTVYQTNSGSYATIQFANNKFLPLSGGTLDNNGVNEVVLKVQGAADKLLIGTGNATGLGISLSSVNSSENKMSTFNIVASSFNVKTADGRTTFNVDKDGKVTIGDSNYFPYTLPEIDGNDKQILVTDGSGTVTWKNGSYVISDVAAASALWNSVYTTVSAFSASWEESEDIQAVVDDVSNLAVASGSWNSVYTTTNSNSALWTNWSEVSGNYALGSNYVKLSGDTMTGALSAPALSADSVTASIFYGTVGETNIFPGGSRGYITVNGGPGDIEFENSGKPGGIIDLTSGGIYGSIKTNPENGDWNLRIQGKINTSNFIDPTHDKIPSSGDPGVGGYICTAGEDSGVGGYIDTSGIGNNSGGYINTKSSNYHSGGYINTSGHSNNDGGYINTSGGLQGPGGYINTSNGGGNIDTRSGDTAGGYSGGAGGYINLRGGDGDTVEGTPGSPGGYIRMVGKTSNNAPGGAGYIDTSAGWENRGGYINTSGASGNIGTRYQDANGGDIDTRGGNFNFSTGGSINTRGGDADNSTGGNINTSGGSFSYNRGGYINTSGGNDSTNSWGGYINTSGGNENSPGGLINLSGGRVDSPGGYINTSGGGTSAPGGYINTSGDEVPGGYIDTSSGGYINTSRGGYINTSEGGYIRTAGENGGYIDVGTPIGSSAQAGAGGYIKTIGGLRGNPGGYINTSGNYDSDDIYPGTGGGYIDTSGNNSGPGGSINTSNGGGSIDTRERGTIEFGNNSTRTTLSGSATENRIVYLPNNNGTLALISDVKKCLPLSGGQINGDLVINGSLTALSAATFVNTIFTTTSALSVINLGVGPALYVYQTSGNSDIASFYDGDGIEVLHVGNAPGGGNPLGKVGINTSYPSAELTVKGSISGNGSINIGNISLSNATVNIPASVSDNGQFLILNINGTNKAIRLWDIT